MTTQKRKFGKKNTIKIDPLAYNIGLIGESGIGKTSTLIEVADKLAGEDGYMLLSLGKEDAVDAISGAIFEEVPDWDTFIEITDDIIENKKTDYKELRVLIYDTIDQLYDIAEQHVIELHNADCKADKRTKTINGALGGFGKGQEKTIQIIQDRLWELKRVGVGMIIVGHTKRKTLSDIATGEEYEMLTTNISEKYFNAIKTKLHVLGVASIDRSIEYQKIKQRMGEDKEVGRITGESRIITFRDDNFNIDSKSRFAEIDNKIDLNSDAFIKTLTDAIAAQQKKDGNDKPIEEVAKEQAQEREEKADKEIEKKENKVDIEKNTELATELLTIYNSKDAEGKAEMVQYMKDNGVSLKDKENTPTKNYQEAISKFK